MLCAGLCAVFGAVAACSGPSAPPGGEGGGGGGTTVAPGGLGGEPVRGETVTPPTCEATDTDDPDADFIDSNCDGIDGDLERAVFVSPLGNNNDDGSRSRPVETLAKALQLAIDNDLDVYACSATYEENMVLEGTGVRL